MPIPESLEWKRSIERKNIKIEFNEQNKRGQKAAKSKHNMEGDHAAGVREALRSAQFVDEGTQYVLLNQRQNIKV